MKMYTFGINRREEYIGKVSFDFQLPVIRIAVYYINDWELWLLMIGTDGVTPASCKL